MEVGEVERVTKAVEGVDTVVVVEENICNKNKRKDLLGLISSIQKAYKAEGKGGRMRERKIGIELMKKNW